MNTFTFFLHGSMHHEEGRKRSMVSALARECSSGGYIINGPGGRSLDPDKASTIPGTYKIDPKTGEKIPKITRIHDAITGAVGAATGWGVEDNLIEMLLIVSRQDPLPETINLCGFSRGADSCLRFANLMDKYYPAVKINIFAVEPVAGPGRREAIEARFIPSNVQHYVSTLAIHQKNPLFEAQDLSRLYAEDVDHTTVEVLPFPGTHGKHSKIHDDKKKTHSASELIMDLAVERLEQWGTTFRHEPPYIVDPKDGSRTFYKKRTRPSDVELLDKYAEMIFNKDVYGKPATETRFFVRRSQDYIPILPQCFVNQHHLKLFAKTYPATFRYIMDPTERRKKNSDTELQGFPEIKKWLELTFTPIQNKKRLYFDPSKDRLDGNYLRVVMAVHRFQNKESTLGLGVHETDQLLRDCRRIMGQQHDDKEAMIEGAVNAFITNNPKHSINNLLKERLTAKRKTFREKVKHELTGLFNRTILQQIIHSLSKTFSEKYRNMYESIKNEIRDVLDNIDATGDLKTLLRTACRNVANDRERLGIKKLFDGELAIEKMVEAAYNYGKLSPSELERPEVLVENQKKSNDITREEISSFSQFINNLREFKVDSYTRGEMRAVISRRESKNEYLVKQDRQGYHFTAKARNITSTVLTDLILAVKEVAGPGGQIKIQHASDQQRIKLQKLATEHGLTLEATPELGAKPSG